MRELILISCSGQDQDGRILELAQWMGVGARSVILGEAPTRDHLVRELGGRCTAVLSADTLSFLRERLSAGALRALIDQHCTKLLVISGHSPENHQDLFRWLTDGLVQGLAAPEQAQAFRFPEKERPLSGPFAGQSFAPAGATAASSFVLSASGSRAGVQPILLANERPVFLRMQHGECALFLLAADKIPCINTPLDQRTGIAEHYGQLIPLLIFLRASFGEACWHGLQSTAHVIIDDPLLEPAYGCLSYAALRRSMHAAGYASSIAFIPWNHWRTSRTRAAQALAQDERLSICVHGCDHTNREFDDVDPGSLQWKAATALRRMERHQLRTGVPFDPVMVFPQGKFASPALAALRNSGYLAAVNTEWFPTNNAEQPITIADLLRPAITKFDGFPLFQRRQPRRLIDFAFDAFLGRPLLIVQHHDDFRDGYQHIEDFAHGLRGLAPNLTWSPLATQLMQSCIVRSTGEGLKEVRFFTSHFRFESMAPAPPSILFSKEEPDPAAISSVLVNGAHVPFSFRDGFLIFEHRAEANQAIDVVVCDRARLPAPASRGLGVRHAAGVCVRRALSEFRDKALVKHPQLLAAATGIAARLKATGDSAP
jgi:hypothetical protein